MLSRYAITCPPAVHGSLATSGPYGSRRSPPSVPGARYPARLGAVVRPDSTGGPEDVPVRASTVACRRQSRRLGEATHGTRECFEHKDRLIRSLVTECGVRIVAFEVDAAAATVLDTFVRDGSALSTAPADAAAALAELDMWQCGQSPSATCSSGSRRSTPEVRCRRRSGSPPRSTTRDYRLAQKGFRRMIAGLRL